MRPLRSKRRHSATQAAVAAAVLTVAGTVAVLLRRIQPPAGVGEAGPSPVPSEAPPQATAQDEEIRCECGKAYRVTGAGRHRVIWPEGADKHEALLEEECLECGRSLASAA